MLDPVGQQLGALTARMGNVETDVAEIKADVKELLASRSWLRGATQIFQLVLPFVALGVSFMALGGAK